MKKVIAALLAVTMFAAMPAMAVAVGSVSGETKTFESGSVADFSSVSGTNGDVIKSDLIVTSTTTAASTLTEKLPTGANTVYFTATAGSVTENFGTLTLSFYVGTEHAGKSSTVHHLMTNGGYETFNVTISASGMATVTVSNLSEFAIVISDTVVSGGSTTSPKTGALDMTGVALATGAAAVAAAGVFVLLRRRSHN